MNRHDNHPTEAELDVDVFGVMAGLTAAETAEFNALDARNFVDDNGNPFPWPWDVTGAAKNRWLQLYEKHEAALKKLKAYRLERLR